MRPSQYYGLLSAIYLVGAAAAREPVTGLVFVCIAVGCLVLGFRFASAEAAGKEEK